MTLSFRNLFRGLTGRPAARPRARPARPQVEQLEERAVPTTLVDLTGRTFGDFTLLGGTRPGQLAVGHATNNKGDTFTAALRYIQCTPQPPPLGGEECLPTGPAMPVTIWLTQPRKGSTQDGVQFSYNPGSPFLFRHYHLTFNGTVTTPSPGPFGDLEMTGRLTEYIPVGRFGMRVLTTHEDAISPGLPE